MGNHDFHPEVFQLFDGYTHGFIDRREFLEGVSKFAVGGMTAAAILQAAPDPPFDGIVPLAQQCEERIEIAAQVRPVDTPASNQTRRRIDRPIGLRRQPFALFVQKIQSSSAAAMIATSEAGATI